MRLKPDNSRTIEFPSEISQTSRKSLGAVWTRTGVLAKSLVETRDKAYNVIEVKVDDDVVVVLGITRS